MTTTPPEKPAGEPISDADQAKDDGKEALASIAKGALTGGAAGAAKGAVTAVLKTKTGRKGLAAVVAIPVILIAVLFAGMGMGGAAPNTFGLEESRTALSMEAVSAEFEDKAAIKAAQEAASRYDVEWQLVLAVQAHQQSRTRDKGTGPYGIDHESAGISEEDAKDQSTAAAFIASKLTDTMAGTVKSVDGLSLTSGTVMSTGDEAGTSFSESTDTNDIAAAAESEKQYTAALEGIPVKGNPEAASFTYKMARSWALGQANKCVASDPSLVPETSVDLNDQQKKYAKQVVDAVLVRALPKRAAVVALATVMQESTFRMWWNPSVPGSEALTDDKGAKGVDGYSVGLFQQQVNGTSFSWGSVDDAMSPSKSADMFLDVLVRIPGWEDMEVASAAQSVQGSAHPDKYAQWEKMATQLADDLWSGGDEPAHKEEESDSAPGPIGTLPDGAHLSVNPLGTKDLRAVSQAVKDKFGNYVFALGDFRGDSDHATYRAVDLMIADYKSGTGVANGDKIAKFFTDNAAIYGVEYLIWQDKIWLGKAEGWKPYSTGGYGGMYAGNWNDTTKHMDHVHVNVYGDKGTGGEGVYDPEGSDSGTGCPSAGTGNSTSPGAGDDYPYREPAGSCAYCSAVDAGGAVDPWSLYKRECVSFVAWRINQQMGWKEGQEYPFTPAKMGLALFGNAAEWSGNLRSAGYTTDTNPTPGSIAWWDSNASNSSIQTGSAGHVGIVLSADTAAGTVTIEQYNADPWKYSVMTIPIAHVTGFIHVADLKDGSQSGKDVKAEE